VFAAGMVCFMAIGALLLKTGAVRSGWQPLPDGPVLNFRVITGLGFYVISVGFYIALLRVVPLNVAQAFAAAQFVLVIVAARVLLGEQIDAVRWAGLGLILAGIFVVGWTHEWR
jgi:multidrug transporter EmrE-like cation transporter